MPTDTTTDLFASVTSIDWNDLAAVAAASNKILTALDTHRSVLRELAEHAIRAVRKVVSPGQRMFLSIGAGRRQWDGSRS